MKKRQDHVRSVLELKAALQGSRFETIAQAILLAVLVAAAFASIAANIAAGISSLSDKKVVACYHSLREAINWLCARSRLFANSILNGKARNPDRIRSLTPWGKAKAWLIVVIAAPYCALFTFLGVLMWALASLKITTIPINLYAQGMGWGLASLLLARSFFNDVRYNWPIVRVDRQGLDQR